MSLEDVKQVVRKQIEAITSGDYEAMARYVDENMVNHNPFPGEPERGLKAVQDTIRKFHTGFSDYRMEIRDLLAEGDKVAILVSITGKHTGPFMGSEPTGKQMSVEGLMVLRVENGKIVERWAQIDLLTLTQQLGIRPQLQQAA